jgi:2-polyprenyl-3-methyl-5-hydroxy-6-metoxy-1,4-benzoquinol methylase
MISLSSCNTNDTLSQQPTTPLGIESSLTSLDRLTASLPASAPINSKGTSFLTYNNYGFSDFENDINNNNWLIKETLEHASQAKLPILDIGGGYGSLSKKLLEKKATVILNDMDERHLLLARKSIDKSCYNKFYLKPGKFPQDLDFPDNSLSSVILFRVLLFLSPAEIEEGLTKINKWLKPGGKFFISTLPPQRGEYKDKVLPIYETRLAAGDKWPGYDFNTVDILTKDIEHFPASLHLMDEKPLEIILRKLGFTIEKFGLIESIRGEKSGKELFGLIALKD